MNVLRSLTVKINQLAGYLPGKGNVSQKILVVILFLAFVVRVYVSFLSGLPNMHRDSYDYFQQADTLLAGGYTNFFPNGYPFLIALVKTVAGEHAIIVLLWLNILLSTLGIFFIYDIGKRLFQLEAIALLAAFILAFFPSQINYVRWLTTELPTAFFLLGGYFFYYRKKNGWGGIFFGIAAVIRTEILPILILLLIIELVYKKKFNVYLITGALIPILLVGSYCYLKTGSFALAGHGRVNMLISVTASGGSIDWNIVDKHPEINTSGKALKMYIDHFKADPVRFTKNRLANLWELWGFYPSSSEENRGILSRLIIGAGNFFLLVFGLVGWWKNRKEFKVFVFILPFIVVTLIHIIFFALPRYTYPVEAFMILLAVWTLYRLFSRRLPA